jgi:hypothetical protein
MFDTLTGLEYLQVEIACKHDKAFEKETWADRIAHFKSLDLSAPATFKLASNPIGLRAAVKAYEDTNSGIPTGYMISLDACSSGLQILSLLVSCPTSFNLCGGDSDDCVDSYTTIYDSMHLSGSLTRKQVKAAIMTSLYGSVAMPELTFGNNVDLFYETMEKMAPGAWDLNLGLQELWDKIPGNVYDWVMPDNFHACIETSDKELVEFTFDGEKFALPQKIDARPKFHKGLGPNLIHSVDGMVVREMFRRCMFSKDTVMTVVAAITAEKQGSNLDERGLMVQELWENYLITGFLSVRILDYIDVSNIGHVDSLIIAQLVQTLPEEPFDVVSVHDCFRAHANYGNDLRRQYNLIMADINDSTLLTSLCSQVSKSHLPIKKLGKIPREDIVNANYMLA